MSILTTLGYTPYGIDEIFKEKHSSIWTDILLRKKEVEHHLFDGYDAIVVTPAAISFYNELLKMYPNAKFIMEEVDSLTCYKRLKKSQRVFKSLFFLRIFKSIGVFFKMLDLSLYSVTKGKQDSISIQSYYNEYVYAIKKDIPTKRLKVISSSAGWQPICDFLEHTIPDKKYPSQLNSTQINQDVWRFIINGTKGNIIPLIIYFSILIGLILYLIFFY